MAFRPIYGTYSEAALACYRDRELRFTAFVAAPEGLGGARSYRIEPLWLASPGHWLAVDDSKQPEEFYSGPFLPVAARPRIEAALTDQDHRWVEVVGHFSDPAAEKCRVTLGSGEPSAPTADQAIEICRTSFVVSALKRVAAPSPSQ